MSEENNINELSGLPKATDPFDSMEFAALRELQTANDRPQEEATPQFIDAHSSSGSAESTGANANSSPEPVSAAEPSAGSETSLPPEHEIKAGELHEYTPKHHLRDKRRVPIKDDTAPVAPKPSGKLAKMWRNPAYQSIRAGIAALILIAMCFGAVFYYGGLLRQASDPGGAALSYIADPKAQRSRYKAVSSGPAAQKLTLIGSSVEEDLSILALDSEGANITGFGFEFSVTDPDGKSENYIDDDMDGLVYIDGLEKGEYTVEMTEIDGFETPEPLIVEVEGPVEYVKIENISEIIVNSSEIDRPSDDAQYGGGNTTGGSNSQPTTSSNTVEYVESSKNETQVEKEVERIGYIGAIATDGTGRLLYADGTASNIIPNVDVNGRLTGEYSMFESPEEPETPVDPSEPSTPSEPTDPGNDQSSEPGSSETPTDEGGIGGDIDLFAKDAAGAYIYKITEDKYTEKIIETVTTYYGWQTLEGKTYFFDKNGKKVTGTQTIKGSVYMFDNDGVLRNETGTLGIDVSEWQGNINWSKVKAAGISYVIIRCGFRGYGSGKIVEDGSFKSYIAGATAAGLKVGVYFYTQAITTHEAVEEASATLELIKGYPISYPVAIDIEYCGSSSGRTVNLTNAERTKICVAFCETIRGAGYTPAVYANKNWLETKLNTGSFGSYKIWLAHFTSSKTSYAGRYDIWQYSSTGSVNGISGNVDMNLSYMGY